MDSPEVPYAQRLADSGKYVLDSYALIGYLEKKGIIAIQWLHQSAAADL